MDTSRCYSWKVNNSHRPHLWDESSVSKVCTRNNPHHQQELEEIKKMYSKLIQAA